MEERDDREQRDDKETNAPTREANFRRRAWEPINDATAFSPLPSSSRSRSTRRPVVADRLRNIREHVNVRYGNRVIPIAQFVFNYSPVRLLSHHLPNQSVKRTKADLSS